MNLLIVCLEMMQIRDKGANNRVRKPGLEEDA